MLFQWYPPLLLFWSHVILPRESNYKQLFESTPHASTLFILMDFPMHIERLSIELPILYFKGITCIDF